MNPYAGRTAAGLAALLARAGTAPPHATGVLSMLHEAAVPFCGRPQVAAALAAFSQARHAHHHSYDPQSGSFSDETWREVVAAARELAAVLRPLGEATR